MADVRTAAPSAQGSAPSLFDDMMTADAATIGSSKEAVRAAVVAIAKDMEFIGRGGFLMPPLIELRKFVTNCVPHIVKGEYIDSYFINQDHGKTFWKLRGRGFSADDTSISEALSEIEPIYDAILRSIAGQKDPDTQAAEKPTGTLARMTSQEAAVFTRFNYLAQRFGADAADVIAELRDGLHKENRNGKELVIVTVFPVAEPSIARMASHAGFIKKPNGHYVLTAHDTRELLHLLATALNQNSTPTPEQLRASN